MGIHEWYDCRWTIKLLQDKKIINLLEDKRNILVDEGEKAIVDVFFRKKDSVYFSDDYFYVGLYRGSISESTTLATIPNEPSGNGYSRLQLERSTTGFPTIEQYDGHWRVVSKELSMTASGGDIGPINGAFLCTSSDNLGSLIGAVGIGVETTITSGSTILIQLKLRQK